MSFSVQLAGDRLRVVSEPSSSTVTFVGEAPSQHSDPSRPFRGASGERLAAWCGMHSFEELERRAILRNLLPRWPGPGHRGEKGSRFPVDEARVAARGISRSPPSCVVVLAGVRVARAFGFDAPPFRWAPLDPSDRRYSPLFFGDWSPSFPVAATIPHPSGCNRFYNDPRNRTKVARFLRRLFPIPGRA